MNISTCQAAQSIVGGLWPKTQAASSQICQDLGTKHDVFSDWAASRQGCGVGVRNQYPALRGKQSPRYAQDSPDLRQKEIIKVIKKVFMQATGVDKCAAINRSDMPI